VVVLPNQMCIARNAFCHEDKPGNFALLAVEFCLNVMLVWIAFLLLPFSKKYGGSKFISEGTSEDERASRLEEGKVVRVCCGCACTANEDRGGRLAVLLRYDAWAILICLITFAVLSWLWSSLELALLWAENLHGYLSFPFALFIVPGLQRILTHTEPTGFTKLGKCVAQEFDHSKTRKDKPSVAPTSAD